MHTTNPFKEDKSLEKRLKASQTVLQNYPDCVPIIVQKAESCKLAEDIKQKKFLVPKELTIGQFLYVIRRKIELKPEQAIFFFVNNVLPPTSANMGDIYEKYHDEEDKFLYTFFTTENTFGAL